MQKENRSGARCFSTHPFSLSQGGEFHMLYSYDRELYFRIFWFFKKRLELEISKDQLKGRTYPAIPRQDEEYKLPDLRTSNDWFCYLIALIQTNERNDWAIAKVLQHISRMAERYQYSGSWEIWKKLIIRFDIRNDIKSDEKEFTMFSLPDFADFLSENFTEDEIFGNLLKRSIQLARLIRIRTIKLSVKDPRPVIYPQRHRGYRDKGSSAPVGSREFREANRLPEKIKEPRVDFLSEVIVWGDPPPSD